ncbi:AbgT family transporter [Marinisporobacter balticus]|uniref:Aminobenzoyl-glutamate transport protein n=1 Tax=Marinisporobacter balticus TaxID=2018667 RepID=A0A4R2KL38_9FIRM|nr:AbgT family transporter [Marinisporobacter balticus]TCO70738.1 aminobenzoyl-glutamate transport protein [Marinisporobacter balticus]
MSNTAKVEAKNTRFAKFIKGIEVVGNKLPHPFTLFVGLAVTVLILSFVLAKMGVSVTYLAASKNPGEAPKETVVAITNLLSYDGMRPFMENFVKTYVQFAPLGLIMTMMLGIGMVEQTGLINAFMRKTILGAPSYMVTAVLAIVGINANLASDAGMIFTAAIGGAIFKALGRNPKVGIVSGFAAASGGFTANFLIAGTDALLAGITESVATGSGIAAPTHPLINWYFMIAATFVVTFLTTVVTEKFTVKFLGDSSDAVDKSILKEHTVTEQESKGLRNTGIAAVLYILLIVMMTVPEGSFFRNADGNILPKSTFTKSVVPILFFFFLIVGVSYGKTVGVIKGEADIPKLMQKGLAGCLSFLVVALPAAMFIDLFNQSNLTTVLAVKGATLLKSLNLGGIPLIIMFIMLASFVNLFMISGSSKWLILGPIFVPMFAMLGLSPAVTQLAYRIGDSSTNIISPLSYYIPVVIGLMDQYKTDENEKNGIGTVISLLMPYSLAYLVGFTLLLIGWYFLKFPIGPGTSIFM